MQDLYKENHKTLLMDVKKIWIGRLHYESVHSYKINLQIKRSYEKIQG